MVGDVELVLIPAFGGLQGSLFDDPPAHLDQNLADLAIGLMRTDGTLDARPNVNGSITYGPLNKLLVHRRTGIPIDIFSTRTDFWGMTLLVRTGPKDFNIKVMRQFRSLGLKGHAYAGVSDGHGSELPCPTEDEVFRLLQWRYLPPKERR